MKYLSRQNPIEGKESDSYYKFSVLGCLSPLGSQCSLHKEFEKKKAIELLKFDHEMQMQRIKSAEIRKNMERKRDLKILEDYKWI